MSGSRPFHVCVVGAGITGLACALASARAGARVDVHEATCDRKALPAHVNVAPNLVRDLVALGLGEQIALAGFPYCRMVVRDVCGQERFAMAWRSLAGARYPAAVGIAYDTLIQLLARAALAAGACIHPGSEVQDVVLAHSRGVVNVRGEASRPDLIVLASGSDCALRGRVFPHAQPPAVWPQRWLHTLLPRPPGLDEMSLTMTPGGGPKMTLAPVDGRVAGLTISHQRPGDSIVRIGALPAEIGEWLRRTSDWTRAVATGLDDRIPVVERPLRSGLVAGDWHRANVLLAGDCAHAFAPQFGQSVAQGIEDAVVIGHLVHAAHHVDGSALGRLYTARRRPRAARVHELVELAARWDLSPEANTDLPSITQDLLDAVALPP